VPERWYSKPEMILNRKAFAPFALGGLYIACHFLLNALLTGTGAYYCIGKNLAYMEIQYAISSLVSKYDVRFAPGETGKRVVDDMVDQFTAAPGQLQLVFDRRR
jgi:cytochrome P450